MTAGGSAMPPVEALLLQVLDAADNEREAVLAAIHDPAAIRKVLEALGRWADVPVRPRHGHRRGRTRWSLRAGSHRQAPVAVRQRTGHLRGPCRLGDFRRFLAQRPARADDGRRRHGRRLKGRAYTGDQRHRYGVLLQGLSR
jgi:hypothetical protein